MIDEHLKHKEIGLFLEEDESMEWPTDEVERLSIQYSIPFFLTKLIVHQIGFCLARSYCVSSNTAGSVSIRRNAIKCPSDQSLMEMIGGESNVVPIPNPYAGLRFPSTPKIFPSIWSLRSYQSGAFEVQDEGSQRISLATQVSKGESVLDYCAGNGGKTLAMASMMDGAGHIVAHDVNDTRLRQLQGSLERAGVGVAPNDVCVECVSDDSKIVRTELFDVVLVDAPCSSTGVLRRRPSQRWRLTEQDVTEAFPALQMEILHRASSFVRADGGRLVYATCSVLESENQDVARWFEGLQGFCDEWTPWPWEDSNSVSSDPGHSHWLQILPTDTTDGFFIARWKRKPAANQ
jgi:16S rRNA (cytosine967-C5)-methyltransferase